MVVIGIVQCGPALYKVGPQPSQVFGGEPDLFADLVANAPKVTKTNAIDCEKFARIVDPHAFQNVLRVEGVTQLGHGGGGRGREGRRGRKTLGLGWMHGLPGGEDGAPGAKHFFRVVKAPFEIAPQGFGKKCSEAFARDRVKHFACDGGFHVQHGR